jgi:hypothetical protein
MRPPRVSRRRRQSVNRTARRVHHECFALVCQLSNIEQEMKMKSQELRLYETVLMQGIHNIKSLANDAPVPDLQVSRPLAGRLAAILTCPLKKLDQSASMLNVTCDAFIHTLDECARLTNGGASRSSLLLASLAKPLTPDASQHRTDVAAGVAEHVVPDRPHSPVRSSAEEHRYDTFFSRLPST